MGRAIVAISGSAAGFLHRPLSSFGGPVARLWRNLTRTLFDSYHPEQHYMRGPGPACQAKRGHAQG